MGQREAGSFFWRMAAKSQLGATNTAIRHLLCGPPIGMNKPPPLPAQADPGAGASGQPVRRGRLPAWVALASVLGFAVLFRTLGVATAGRLDEPDGPTAQLVFAGVAICAATVAALIGRIWSTPAAAVVLGMIGGLTATIFQHSVPGAMVGLAVGMFVAGNAALRTGAWVLRGALWGAFGGAVGAAGSFFWAQGGWQGAGRAAAAVGLGAVAALVFLSSDKRAVDARLSRRLAGSASLWVRVALMLLGGYFGARFGAESLAAWLH